MKKGDGPPNSYPIDGKFGAKGGGIPDKLAGGANNNPCGGIIIWLTNPPVGGGTDPIGSILPGNEFAA